MNDRPKRRPPSGRLRERLVNLGLVLGSLLLVFVALEIGLRLLGSNAGDWYAAGPQRLEFLRDHVQRNRHGFRDREFSYPRTPGRRRVLAVGDSFTFGDGIERVEDTWPRVLEARLIESGGDWEVYNLAVPGTNTSFQRDMLNRRDHWSFLPDLVILGFTLNDPEPPDANRTIVPRKLNPPLLPPRGLDRRLTRRSYAWAFARRTKNALLERFGLKMTYGDYIRSLYEDDAANWDYFVQQSEGLVRDARERGIQLLVVVFPMFTNLEQYPFEAFHTASFEVFAGAGAEVLDLLPVFRGGETTGLAVSATDAHPNERAHRLAAEAIAEKVLDLGRAREWEPPTEAF
jgi:lysophospholipase L1-like esterase